MANTLGVAYDFEGDFVRNHEDEQTSMYYMQSIVMSDCVGEDAGFFRMVKSGGLQCNRCDLSMKPGFNRTVALLIFKDRPSTAAGVFSTLYPQTRLLEGFNLMGPIQVMNSRYTGSDFNFTVGKEDF